MTKNDKTGMHSSRMRTVRNSSHLLGGGTWSQGDVPAQGGYLVLGVYLVPGGVPGPGGCTCPQGVPARGCTCPGGGVPGPRVVYLVLGGVPGPKGVPAWGVYLPRYTPPPPCGQTDRCKNITFATSLRTVIILLSDLNV